MNILIYTSNSRYSNKAVGGAETALELIAQKLSSLGENVTLATIELSLGKEKIRFKKNSKKLRFKVYNLHPLLWPKHPLLFPELRRRFLNYQIQKFVATIIRSEKIDIAHSYEIHDTLTLLATKKRFKVNFKIVKRVAGLYWAHRINIGKIKKETVERVFRSVNAVNYLTYQSRSLVLETAQKYNLHLHAKKEFIVDIGIDLSLFSYQWQPRTKKPFKIISVLRFAFYQKRPDILIQALSLASHKDIQIDFIGVGADMEECKKLCDQLDLNDRVFFQGFLDQERIAQMLLDSDIFALPTLDEGMPKSLLEAMAVGVPVLVSDVSPINSYIKNLDNGFVIGNTPQEWAKKIDLLYETSPEIFSKVSHKAEKFVKENYDADKNSLKYQEMFKDVLVDNDPNDIPVF